MSVNEKKILDLKKPKMSRNRFKKRQKCLATKIILVIESLGHKCFLGFTQKVMALTTPVAIMLTTALVMTINRVIILCKSLPIYSMLETFFSFLFALLCPQKEKS